LGGKSSEGEGGGRGTPDKPEAIDQKLIENWNVPERRKSLKIGGSKELTKVGGKEWER